MFLIIWTKIRQIVPSLRTKNGHISSHSELPSQSITLTPPAYSILIRYGQAFLCRTFWSHRGSPMDLKGKQPHGTVSGKCQNETQNLCGEHQLQNPTGNRSVRNHESHLLQLGQATSQQHHHRPNRIGKNFPCLRLNQKGLPGRASRPLTPFTQVLLSDGLVEGGWKLWQAH